MDRVAAMLILLGVLVSLVLMLLALFAVAPVFCSCLISLLYTLYLFFTNEESGIHHAQEFENRFWTIFALLFSTALFFAKDSPIAFGRWSPSLGFFGVILAGYVMHTWDRYLHRVAISRQVGLRRSGTATSSLNRLKDLGIPVEDQLAKITSSLADIDQLLIPSTINNFLNERFVLRKEREIITVFQECDARALNYLISHVKLGLLFYKIKDHRNFSGQNRTELIELLAVDRLPALTVMSRVIVLHALQLMRLRANTRGEYWVRNVILSTSQDDLSELKTLTDAKGDYFCMNKLIYDDIKSETIRQDILNHIRKEAAVQQAHMQMGTRKAKLRQNKAWRKILSDVDDTLCCSGGSYPAGIDKRYGKKVVYPGVLAFYRELDLGIQGPEEWPENRVGNLVFLSARPHVYKDMSEKVNFAKFEKLRILGDGSRKGLHTIPSLLAGDIASGRNYIVTNDMEPLALKKFDNFKRYASIYPEFNHVFICDNGQGDVRAGEMMFDYFPYEFEALYVHVVQDITKTHGFAPERWRAKGLKPCFFRTYPEAALDAVKRNPPIIRVTGLQRVCQDAVKDFEHITSKQWSSHRQKMDRRAEINQAIWRANEYLEQNGVKPVALIEAERIWDDGQRVKTPYGIARIVSFDPVFDMYEVEIDWRPINIQVAEHYTEEKKETNVSRPRTNATSEITSSSLETVVEIEECDDEHADVHEQDSQHDLNAESVVQAIAPKHGDITELQGSVKVSDADGVSTAGASTGELLPADGGNVGKTDGELSIPIDGGFPPVPIDQLQFRVTARMQSRDITKYTPPILPKLVDKERASLFSFWGTAADTPKKMNIAVGDKCTTPYGPGIVEEYRDEAGIVVVDMVGWKARAYLQQSDVKVVSKGLFHSLRRQFSSTEPPPKALEFPYAEGTVIKTPFGQGSITRPLPMPPKSDASKVDSKQNSQKERIDAKKGPQTLGISLTSWALADKSHPMLYCTLETAKTWKDGKKAIEKAAGDGLLSALGSFVTKSLLGTRGSQVEKKPPNTAHPAKLFQQYYRDGAAVTTTFGNGVVRRFREADGFYEISLVNWTLANGAHAIATLQKNEISHRIAKGCHEGYPVLTSLGLTGTLASVEPTTGVHLVTVHSAGMVCYLQPEHVIRPIKAAVGQDVLTAYGDGKVTRYRGSDDMYIIKLNGWNATLYAKAETFDRDGDSMQTRDGPFGMKWLLGLLFFSSPDGKTNSQRSRSNSIVSLGKRSQSGRSAT